MNKLKKGIGLLIAVVSICYLVFTLVYETSIMEIPKSVEVFHGDELVNGVFMIKDYCVVGNDMLGLFSVAGKELLHLMVKSSVAQNKTNRDTIQLDFLQKACKVA